MFEFLTVLFHKVVSLVSVAVVAIGLVSAPASAPNVEEEAVKAEVQRIEAQLNPTANITDAMSPEDSLKSAIEDIEKQLEASANEPVVEKSEPKAKAQVIETILPEEEEPVIATPPLPLPAPQPVIPATFTLPNGTVVDQYGNPVGSSGSAPSSVEVLPAGWSKLPNGRYLAPYGDTVDKIPDYLLNQAQQTQTQTQAVQYKPLPAGWTQLQSGMYKDADGHLHDTLPQ